MLGILEVEKVPLNGNQLPKGKRWSLVPLPCCPERLDLAPERLETVSWKPVPPPERPKLALEMPEQACYRLEPVPESLILALDRPEPVPVRPEPAPERPEMIALLEAQASLREAFGQRGDRWMEEPTYRFPLCSTGPHHPLGMKPKKD